MPFRAGKRGSNGGGADVLSRMATAALAAALENGQSPEPAQKSRKKKRFNGVRAVATGAVIYTAGKAAVRGYEAVRDELAEDEEYEEEE
jgi:hypothetical protein